MPDGRRYRHHAPPPEVMAADFTHPCRMDASAGVVDAGPGISIKAAIARAIFLLPPATREKMPEGALPVPWPRLKRIPALTG